MNAVRSLPGAPFGPSVTFTPLARKTASALSRSGTETAKWSLTLPRVDWIPLIPRQSAA